MVKYWFNNFKLSIIKDETKENDGSHKRWFPTKIGLGVFWINSDWFFKISTKGGLEFPARIIKKQLKKPSVFQALF